MSNHNSRSIGVCVKFGFLQIVLIHVAAQASWLVVFKKFVFVLSNLPYVPNLVCYGKKNVSLVLFTDVSQIYVLPPRVA